MSTSSWDRIVNDRRADIVVLWQEKGLELFEEKMAPHTPLAEGLRDAMDMVLEGFVADDETCREGISGISRILAVQPLRPSRSLLLFRELGAILHTMGPGDADRDECDRRIEEMIFQAFDSFMEHREKIYQLKVEESRSRVAMLLRRHAS